MKPIDGELTAGEQVHAQGETPLTEPRIRFASSVAEAEAGNYSEAFRLFGQRDIVAKIEFPKASLPDQPVIVHFEVLNSSGVPHASKWYAIGADAAGPKTIRHPLFDRDLQVQLLQGRPAQPFFYGKIPVAGTNFTRNRLRGEFTARVSLGADAADDLVSQTFAVER